MSLEIASVLLVLDDNDDKLNLRVIARLQKWYAIRLTTHKKIVYSKFRTLNRKTYDIRVRRVIAEKFVF
jgi:hypothetical protein